MLGRLSHLQWYEGCVPKMLFFHKVCSTVCVATWQIFGLACPQDYPSGVERIVYPLERTQDIDYFGHPSSVRIFDGSLVGAISPGKELAFILSLDDCWRHSCSDTFLQYGSCQHDRILPA